jgi:exodeoxyribonuclease-3
MAPVRHPKSFIAWNVNSLKAICEKNELQPFLKHESPDIFCMGETKLNGSTKEKEFLEHLDAQFPEYPYKFYNISKARKGYSGTAIWCKLPPNQVIYDMHGWVARSPQPGGNTEKPSEADMLKHESQGQEGRVITVEYPKFYVVHVYTPNAGQELKRIEYRIKEWDVEFRKFVKKLEAKKPVILGGDLNTAPEELDIYKPETHHDVAGFTDQERSNFRKLLADANLVDTYRYKKPKEVQYTYWTYLFNARFYKKGWRIDFWLLSEEMKDKIKKTIIWDEQLGSDHAPVGLVLA